MKHASWDTLTVGQFLDLYRLSINTDLDEMGKLERAVAIIYDRTEQEVENMTMGEFTTLSANAAQFLTKNIPGKARRTITGNGHKYRIIYDPTKLRQRQYVEVIHFGDKPIENMHLIMASLVRPVKWGITRRNEAKDHQAIATDMLQAPVKDVYHACVFFLQTLRRFNASYPGLFGKRDDEEGGEPGDGEENRDGFVERYGWIYSTTRIAEHERITLDEAWELPLVQCLNALVYLKQKGIYDKEQIKVLRGNIH